MQAMTQVDDRVNSGKLFENEALIEAMDRVSGTDRRLHLMGLVSDGGVHSWPSHYDGLLKMASARNLSRDQVYVHALMDGRDTPPKSGADRVADLMDMLKSAGAGRIATICGRYYAMDRDNRWERTQLAYDCFTTGEGIRETNPLQAMSNAYGRGETDEFIKPVVLTDPAGSPIGTISDGDSIIFFNFRGDRPRQITRAFTLPGFDGFTRKAHPKIHFTTLTRYEKGVPVDGIAFPPEDLQQDMPNVFGETVSLAGLKQLRIAETEKYAHVTFFFNGQEEKPFPGEDRILVPSPKDVPTYDYKPEMSAPEITEQFTSAIQSGSFDTAICNFANADMVGHTGVLDAATRAVSTVDKCLGEILESIARVDGSAIVTADHGNAEQMVHYETSEPHTAHTTNPVPLVLVDKHFQGELHEGGALCDVAPTLLALLGVSKPEEMTGNDIRS
jgi:2,3-bisphosphoglycerate-independent phosphoglycerate mutase